MSRIAGWARSWSAAARVARGPGARLPRLLLAECAELQDPYWLLDTVHARLYAEAGASHLEFDQLPLVAQEQVLTWY